MFETAELGRTISKKQFKKAEILLRQDLLKHQDELHQRKDFQVILLFAGVEGGGKAETVGQLNAWMDPRWLVTRAYDAPSDVEAERPEFWKYWRDLPQSGQIGMFLSAWYSRPVLDAAYGQTSEAHLLKRLERIIQFERSLAQNGALILKFWMHLSRKEQEERLNNLQNDPLTKAKVTKQDWANWKNYDGFIRTAEQVISRTNRGLAPWTVIEGADPNYRLVTVTTILRDALERRLNSSPEHNQTADHLIMTGVTEKQKDLPVKGRKKAKSPNKLCKDAHKKLQTRTVLDSLDMTQSLEKEDYQGQLIAEQARLHRLHLLAKTKKVSSLLVFEGPDAAGKGGAIRRVNEALDPRNYQVHGIAAPTDEEQSQHYLWRFWRCLPGDGHVTIFDRSWYGRVLVERVEKFASDEEWRRSYSEINDFEDQLIEHGIVLVKYWIHITKDEQLARFKLREQTPYKRWKLTDEDWRNRKKWNDYGQAVHDMVQYTSTSSAPWTLVEGNDKRFARVKVVRTFCDHLEAVLERLPKK